MIKKALAGVIGVAALATGVVVTLIAAAIALYFALEPGVGRAGAAGIVAALFALIIGLIVLVVFKRDPKDAEPEPDAGMLDTLLGMAKERPLLSVAAALAATVIVFRNPALVATIAAAFLDGRKHK